MKEPRMEHRLNTDHRGDRSPYFIRENSWLKSFAVFAFFARDSFYKSMTRRCGQLVKSSRGAKARRGRDMKTITMLVTVLLLVWNISAADLLTEKLQRGLFEEEA